MHTTKQNLYNGKGSLKLIWALLLAIACIGTLALVSCPDPDPDNGSKLVITSSETADLKWGDKITYTLTEDGEPVITDIEWSVFRDSVAAAEVSGVTVGGETLNLSDLITQENGVLTIDYRFITDAEAFGTTSYVIAAVYGAKTVTHTTSLKGLYIDITMVAKDAKSFTIDVKPVPFVTLVSEAKITDAPRRVDFGVFSLFGANNIFINDNTGENGVNQTKLNPNANPQSKDGTLSATVEDTFLGALNTGSLVRLKITNTDGSDLSDPVVISFSVQSTGYPILRDIIVEFHPSSISVGQSVSFALFPNNAEAKTTVFNAETSGYVVAPAGESAGK